MFSLFSKGPRFSEKLPYPAYSSLGEGGELDPSYRSSAEEEDSSPMVPNDYKQSRLSRGIIATLIINFILILILVGMLMAQRASHKNDIKETSSSHSPIPKFPEQIKKFNIDPLFLSLPTSESNKAWDDLHGPFKDGVGFIRLDNETAKFYPDDKAGLSVFHQLHCLSVLRMFMWNLLLGEVDKEALIKTWPEDVNNPNYEQATQGLWHYAHCFDYLRQGIQCKADVSLEFVSNKDTGGAIVDGLNYPHECINWDSLWEYSFQHI